MLQSEVTLTVNTEGSRELICSSVRFLATVNTKGANMLQSQVGLAVRTDRADMLQSQISLTVNMGK